MNKPKKRILLVAFAIAVLALGACGTDRSSGSEATPVASSPSTAASADVVNDQTGDTAAASGLDAACVELVLGRTVSSFDSVTDVERTRIFNECNAERLRTGQGPVAGFDPVCVQNATGVEVSDFTELTAEQRQTVFQECGEDERPGNFEGDGRRPAGPGGGVLAPLVDNECAQQVIGNPISESTQLTPEQMQRIFSQCGEELGLPGGGFGQGGFGGGQNGGQGRFGGGQVAPAN